MLDDPLRAGCSRYAKGQFETDFGLTGHRFQGLDHHGHRSVAYFGDPCARFLTAAIEESDPVVYPGAHHPGEMLSNIIRKAQGSCLGQLGNVVATSHGVDVMGALIRRIDKVRKNRSLRISSYDDVGLPATVGWSGTVCSSFVRNASRWRVTWAEGVSNQYEHSLFVPSVPVLSQVPSSLKPVARTGRHSRGSR